MNGNIISAIVCLIGAFIVALILWGLINGKPGKRGKNGPDDGQYPPRLGF